MSKSVVEKSSTAMVSTEGYEEYVGSGFENQTSDDYSIPFLQVLQALSPQLETNDALRPGMIVNTVTGEIYDGKVGIAFVPATTQHMYVEWRPRDQGGGFVGTHAVDSPMVQDCIKNQEFGKFSTPEGNDLIESFYVYGIVIGEDGSPAEAVLSFNATKIKRYKGWMTKAKTIQIELADGRRIPAPLFAHRYRLKTINEKNTKGNFYNWDAVTFDGENAMAARLSTKDPIFQSAVAIKKMIEDGKAKAAFESQHPGAESSDGADSGKPVF